MTLTGKSRIAGVMGWPISHSRSPQIHGYWLKRYKIDGVCVPLAVAPDHLAQTVRALPHLGFAGTSVTLPHKEQILKVMDQVEPMAKRIGAVNTVIVRSDGSLYGINTDGFGFMENINQGYGDWKADQGPVVVLGSGGAARAIVAALMETGVPEIRLVNRTLERARKLAEDMSVDGAKSVVRCLAWEERSQALEAAALLVNTTSLGMTGNPPLDIALDCLPTDSLVTDIVYSPLRTALLQAAASRGNPVLDGLGMLLHQARASFSAWFGVEPEVTEEMRRHVLALPEN